MVVTVGVTLIVDVVAPVLQEYEVAVTVVNTVDVPEQIVGLLTVMVGDGFTVTVEVFDAVQTPEVPVTV